ncbi:MAG: hypothetical protein J0L92_08895 [Deltaproteobacteria bacterium]|nr:hypothetical protein [Deltaproteobacteria bacterium]
MRALSSFSLSLFLVSFGVLGCGGGGSSSGESTSPNGARSQSTNNGSSTSAQGQDVRAGFMDGCRNECFRGGVLTDCPGYCDCMYQRMEADGFERRAQQLASQPDSVTSDPFFQSALAACGPQAIEASFVNGCASSDPALRPVCVCMLGRLCEGRTDEGCAMWILENPNFGNAAPEAAELQRVAGLCTGAGQ